MDLSNPSCLKLRYCPDLLLVFVVTFAVRGTMCSSSVISTDTFTRMSSIREQTGLKCYLTHLWVLRGVCVLGGGVRKQKLVCEGMRGDNAACSSLFPQNTENLKSVQV